MCMCVCILLLHTCADGHDRVKIMCVFVCELACVCVWGCVYLFIKGSVVDEGVDKAPDSQAVPISARGQSVVGIWILFLLVRKRED